MRPADAGSRPPTILSSVDLAAAGRADDRQELAFADLERQRLQRLDLAVARAIRLRDAGRARSAARAIGARRLRRRACERRQAAS